MTFSERATEIAEKVLKQLLADGMDPDEAEVEAYASVGMKPPSSQPSDKKTPSMSALRDIMSEGDRFSMERDAHSNVTVRDSHTGKEKGAGGRKSAELRKAAETSAGQRTMRAFMNEASDGQMGYQDEIAGTTGVFNLPWKLGDERGVATISYDTAKSDLGLAVVQVRDHRGFSMKATPDQLDTILQNAVTYLGRE